MDSSEDDFQEITNESRAIQQICDRASLPSHTLLIELCFIHQLPGRRPGKIQMINLDMTCAPLGTKETLTPISGRGSLWSGWTLVRTYGGKQICSIRLWSRNQCRHFTGAGSYFASPDVNSDSVVNHYGSFCVQFPLQHKEAVLLQFLDVLIILSTQPGSSPHHHLPMTETPGL